jgi:hypothetical protein
MKSKTKKKSRRIRIKKEVKANKIISDKEPSQFSTFLTNFEIEANKSMSIGLDVNNALHNIKWNDPEAKEENDHKWSDDLVGKFYTVLEKLREANALHEKNYYKLNKLF